MMKRLDGISASHGIAIGPALIHEVGLIHLPKRRIAADEVNHEIERLKKALDLTIDQIRRIRDQAQSESKPVFADILSAHMMLLEDEMLINGVSEVIRESQWNAEMAFYTYLLSITSQISASDNNILRERVGDFMDIGRSVIRNLMGIERPSLAELRDEVILVAHDLSPSDTAQIQPGKVLAFVTDIGSRTSHTAIMARALGIPAVVGITDFSNQVEAGDMVIVDGTRGEVIINPTAEILEQYRNRKANLREQEIEFVQRVHHLPAITLDGHHIDLSGNIEFPWEVRSLRENGADGVGLYRTEFLFMKGQMLPTEEEQFEAYDQVARELAPARVIIRTLDVGGDKFVSHLQAPPELNPFLGWRAIRFCLEQKDIFRTQLRAILRASRHGNLWMMYPMVSNVEELRAANRILDDVRRELEGEGVEMGEMKVGTMIETPAAALTVETLSDHSDFFSIGTNDLIQYTLAIDRVNEKIAHLYQPLHPAVLKLIKQIVESAHHHNKWVGVCGEMAADPVHALVLLALGVDELSMSGDSIPVVKTIIRSIEIEELRREVHRLMNLSSDRDIRDWATHIAKEILPDWLMSDGNGGLQETG